MFESEVEYIRNQERQMVSVTEQYKNFLKNIGGTFGMRSQFEVDNLIKMYYLSMDYRYYLMTERWCGLRDKCLTSSNSKCLICGETATQVHHVSYCHRGDRCEYLDLVPLCRMCHERIEELKVRFKNLIMSDLMRDADSEKKNLIEKSVAAFLWLKKSTRTFVGKNHQKIVTSLVRSLASSIDYDTGWGTGYCDLLNCVIHGISEERKNR